MHWGERADPSSCLDEDAIVGLAAGTITAASEARAHLERCDDCRALAAHVARSDHQTRDRLVARAIFEEHVEDLPQGILAERYELDELIGAGGMGFVMSATDLESNTKVAVKFMHRAGAHDPDAVARFEREALAMAALQSAHTVRVWKVGTAFGLPYFVMEHLEGVSLAALVGKCGRLPWRDAVRYAMDVCTALAEAHARAIVHRDIKPQNLFLCAQDGRESVRVLDFGVAKILRAADTLTATSRMLGTPQYMAPEQIRDARTADARTDIWALGATLYRLLSGQHAFPGANAGVICGDILHASPQPLRPKCPDCPPALDRLVMRCLRKSPDERFASAAELRGELERILAGEAAVNEPSLTSTASEGGSKSTPVRRRGRVRWPVIAAAFVAVTALATAAAFAHVKARASSPVEAATAQADVAPPAPPAASSPAPSEVATVEPLPGPATATTRTTAATNHASTKLGTSRKPKPAPPAATSKPAVLYDRF